MGQAFGCLQVDESTLAVKEICGKYKGMLEPGCHCLPWCLCHQVAGKVSLPVQQLDVRCEAKTKDDDFVNVVASIQYRVMEGKDKAKDAFYKLSNPKGLIQAYVFDVIRASVSERTRDSAIKQKNDLANAVKAKHQEAMSAYGFEIVQTLIVDIEPYSTVKWAKNEKNAAAIKSAAQNEKLEVEKILQIKQAEGSTQVEKIWHIKQTEGKTQVEKILQIKRAEGEAKAEGEAEAEKISPIKRAEGEAEAEKISPIKQDEGKAEAEKILQIKQAEGSAQVEKIWRIKQTEGKTQVEKISPIKPAEGEAEAEKISPIKRAEGEAEERG